MARLSSEAQDALSAGPGPPQGPAGALDQEDVALPNSSHGITPLRQCSSKFPGLKALLGTPQAQAMASGKLRMRGGTGMRK